MRVLSVIGVLLLVCGPALAIDEEAPNEVSAFYGYLWGDGAVDDHSSFGLSYERIFPSTGGWGLMVKGDDHRVYQNLSFDNDTGYKILSSEKHENENVRTITRNNVCDTMKGSRRGSPQSNPVPGIVDHNWMADFPLTNVRAVLRDPDNWDFRPKPGAEIIDAGVAIPPETLPNSGAELPDFRHCLEQ